MYWWLALSSPCMHAIAPEWAGRVLIVAEVTVDVDAAKKP